MVKIILIFLFLNFIKLLSNDSALDYYGKPTKLTGNYIIYSVDETFCTNCVNSFIECSDSNVTFKYYFNIDSKNTFTKRAIKEKIKLLSKNKNIEIITLDKELLKDNSNFNSKIEGLDLLQNLIRLNKNEYKIIKYKDVFNMYGNIIDCNLLK